jgi:hypothetical protein
VKQIVTYFVKVAAIMPPAERCNYSLNIPFSQPENGFDHMNILGYNVSITIPTTIKVGINLFQFWVKQSLEVFWSFWMTYDHVYGSSWRLLFICFEAMQQMLLTPPQSYRLVQSSALLHVNCTRKLRSPE